MISPDRPEKLGSHSSNLPTGDREVRAMRAFFIVQPDPEIDGNMGIDANEREEGPMQETSKRRINMAMHLTQFQLPPIQDALIIDNAITPHGVLEKGMNYLQKPFTVDSLARKVREVLDK
jgi:hypothetical protein